MITFNPFRMFSAKKNTNPVKLVSVSRDGSSAADRTQDSRLDLLSKQVYDLTKNLSNVPASDTTTTTYYNVRVRSLGHNPLDVITAVAQIKSITLAAAEEIMQFLPQTILSSVERDRMLYAQEALEKNGAAVEIESFDAVSSTVAGYALYVTGLPTVTEGAIALAQLFARMDIGMPETVTPYDPVLVLASDSRPHVEVLRARIEQMGAKTSVSELKTQFALFYDDSGVSDDTSDAIYSELRAIIAEYGFEPGMASAIKEYVDTSAYSDTTASKLAIAGIPSTKVATVVDRLRAFGLSDTAFTLALYDPIFDDVLHQQGYSLTVTKAEDADVDALGVTVLSIFNRAGVALDDSLQMGISMAPSTAKTIMSSVTFTAAQAGKLYSAIVAESASLGTNKVTLGMHADTSEAMDTTHAALGIDVIADATYWTSRQVSEETIKSIFEV